MVQLLFFDAVAGVEPQSQKQCGDKLQNIMFHEFAFINKLDRVGAD